MASKSEGSDQKSESSPQESPQLAHFRFREKELVDKLKRIAEHPETTAHDIAGSKQRTELALKEVRAEIKRPSK